MVAGIDFIGVTTPFYCNDGRGNFLLHKRSTRTRDEHGTWDPGGGKLEFGQTLEESVLREVREEYGCVGTIQEQLPPLTVIREWQGRSTHWLAIPFFVLVNPADAIMNEPDAMDEIGWFRLDALPEPLHKGFRFTMETYQREFAKYR